MYVCGIIGVFTYACMHAYTYVRIYVRLHACMYGCMCACIHDVYVCLAYVCMYEFNMCVTMYVWVWILV